MKTALVTYFDEGFKPLADYTHPGKIEYCERHGYTLVTNEHFPELNPRSTFDRIPCTLQLLLEGFDIVMWMDADAMFTNHAISIEERLQEYQFAIGTDFNGVNAGMYIAKNTDLVKQMFYSVMQSGAAHVANHYFKEQESLRRLLSLPPYRGIARFAPQREMNAYIMSAHGSLGESEGNWQLGDWIVHFPGLAMAHRVALAHHCSQLVMR